MEQLAAPRTYPTRPLTLRCYHLPSCNVQLIVDISLSQALYILPILILILLFCIYHYNYYNTHNVRLLKPTCA